MARKKSDQANDKEINLKFERQQRQLNRKWMRNAISGIVFLIVIILALQFNPYRNIHLEIFSAAKSLVKNFTSGKHVTVEPNPQYW